MGSSQETQGWVDRPPRSADLGLSPNRPILLQRKEAQLAIIWVVESKSVRSKGRRIGDVDEPRIGGPTSRTKPTQINPLPQEHMSRAHMEATGEGGGRTGPGPGRPTPPGPARAQPPREASNRRLESIPTGDRLRRWILGSAEPGPGPLASNRLQEPPTDL